MTHRIAINTPRVWHLVDARNQIVGRLAPQIAKLLMGKNKPTYTPSVDSGDYVVVVNARHAVFTGNKLRDKLYKWHTGYFGGLKTLTARELQDRAPDRVITHAVRGMLPPNHTRSERLRRLKIFPDDAHVHERQVSASVKYAGEYLAAAAPLSFSPPPKVVGGVLVKDIFPGATPEEREELSKKLVPESNEVALKKLEEYLAAQSSKPAPVPRRKLE